jgi:hypothetical protein
MAEFFKHGLFSHVVASRLLYVSEIKPIIPVKTADEEAKDPSDYATENSRDAEFIANKPPHHG